MSGIVTVKLWDNIIGYLAYEPGQTEVVTFVYDSEFLKNNISPSPLLLPLKQTPYTFDSLSKKSFHGLPGFIADSLPDKFGNQLIDQFFAAKGIAVKEITALDRLLYIGNRAMGALSYEPSEDFGSTSDTMLDLASLCELSDIVINSKEKFTRELNNSKKEQALKLLKVGSSAGGARSKALVAIDANNKLHDGTLEYTFECTYYLLKFDIVGNKDKDSEDPKGMTKVEYIYSLIARECDIMLPDTSFIEDGDDFHFLIERFDKIYIDGYTAHFHYISWCGIAHADRDGQYSYEQLVLTVRELGLGQDSIEEVFRRAIFNLVGRNQDDHTKNFGFLMDAEGNWALSPAFDLTYSFDPTGKWTKQHQISLNGKKDNFTQEDIIAFGKYCNLSKHKSLDILQNIRKAFLTFEEKADKFKVSQKLKDTILQNLRIFI